MGEVMFRISNLSKKFKGKVIALNNVSFEGEKETIIGIVGPNGSGKTTLLSIFSGLTFPDKGNIEIRQNIRIGASVGDASYFPHLTALENLTFVANIKSLGKDYIKKEISKILNLVGLEESKKASTFSFGMEQRYSIAAAMLGDPDIILLDEPTNGIDPLDIEHIKGVIKEASKDRIVIFSSHQLDEVLDLSDYILGLSYGNMLFYQNTKELKKIAKEKEMEPKKYLLEQINEKL